jgi:aldehyde dehydrogenase (NAD+)
MDPRRFFKELHLTARHQGTSTGQQWLAGSSRWLASHSPVDGSVIGHVEWATMEGYEAIVQKAQTAFEKWRQVPAPQRGEVIRQFGDALRHKKSALGALVSYEMGKSLQEGLGEVQEMIDICDYAVGLSRQMCGQTMHSERPQHRMYEQWHPLGPIGIISAFNFPVAVWAWNAVIAAVCGNTSIWKPSEKTPLSAIATMNVLQSVLKQNAVPEGTFCLIVGEAQSVGEAMIADRRLPLISATGSTRMGKRVGAVVGERLGRSLLELGGNNAVIITEHAHLPLAIPAVMFGAVGTAGQRCTSVRRVYVHESKYEAVKSSLVKAYAAVRVGNPLDEKNHVGPLIDAQAVQSMQEALRVAQDQGAKILSGGKALSGADYASGCYVTPTLLEAPLDLAIAKEETFAPILYLFRYTGPVEKAIALQNDVSHGLSSAIFTHNLLEAESFLSATGSDCGIANVNIGTSGAEIGGAFGGEKDTGGGRESGSDSWKAYMRRQTNTINYGHQLPLAQGIRFDLS